MSADVPLFELADNVANGNKPRGHIALVPEGERAAMAAFIDEGPLLKFSAQHSGAMTPATVRALATELNEWADRKDPQPTTCGPLAEVVALLDRLGCTSYTLHATDRSYYASQNPDRAVARVDLRLTIVGRTFLEQVCAALGVKPVERIVNPGQRAWHAEADTPTRRLLIEGVSFQHHDDWEPRA